MNDKEYGKRLVEEMILEQLLNSFPEITGRAVTDEAEGEFAQISASPDFIVGLDGRAFGIELAEIRNVDDAYAYLDGGGDCRLDALSGDGHKKVISSARKLVRLTARPGSSSSARADGEQAGLEPPQPHHLPDEIDDVAHPDLLDHVRGRDRRRDAGGELVVAGEILAAHQGRRRQQERFEERVLNGQLASHCHAAPIKSCVPRKDLARRGPCRKMKNDFGKKRSRCSCTARNRVPAGTTGADFSPRVPFRIRQIRSVPDGGRSADVAGGPVCARRTAASSTRCELSQ